MPRTSHKAKAKAAAVLAAGGTLREAGEAAGRHLSTVHYWKTTDAAFSEGLKNAKEEVLKQAAELATLAHREMVQRLETEPEALEYRDLNRTWGTAADKLITAARDEASAEAEAENLTREQLIDRLAGELDTETLLAIVERQRH